MSKTRCWWDGAVPGEPCPVHDDPRPLMPPLVPPAAQVAPVALPDNALASYAAAINAAFTAHRARTDDPTGLICRIAPPQEGDAVIERTAEITLPATAQALAAAGVYFARLPELACLAALGMSDESPIRGWAPWFGSGWDRPEGRSVLIYPASRHEQIGDDPIARDCLAHGMALWPVTALEACEGWFLVRAPADKRRLFEWRVHQAPHLSVADGKLRVTMRGALVVVCPELALRVKVVSGDDDEPENEEAPA